ncbi:MAG: hypothetical protein ACI9CF_001278 [Candidatus Omnitrophota bacterium]
MNENENNSSDEKILEDALRKIIVQPVPESIKKDFSKDVMNQIHASKRKSFFGWWNSKSLFIRAAAPLLSTVVIFSFFVVLKNGPLNSISSSGSTLAIAAHLDMSLEEQLLILEEFDLESQLNQTL